jgi:Gpi18-like mannosyltransferase/uncharacterized membrane protein (UPF0136 family)
LIFVPGKGDTGSRARTEAGVSKRPTRPGPADAPVADEDRPMRGLPLTRKEVLAVAFVTLLALVIRAILIPAQGHVTDIATFEAWMNTLIKVGPKGFYGTAGFVDYPPGYMLVLWIVGLIYHATFANGDFNLSAMRVFVKLPAVIADIGIGYLTYLIARRSWSVAASIVAMAVFALNPASWLVSAYWGQADSVAAVFLVWALYLCVTKRFDVAWLALAFAVLIKPQPLVVAPMMLVWQIRTQGLTWRLAKVPVIGLAVAYFGSLAFAPTFNPVGLLGWLYDRYHTGIGVYPYNSVNALNLYSINRDFFQPDTQPISFFGLDLGPQYAWGMGIFAALAIATAWRLWRILGSDKDDDARELSFYAAAFVVMLGFFMVVTRQHERYLFSALAIAPLLWNAGPVMRLATVVLSATFSYNLFYALEYLAAPSQDLHPLIVHPLSLINFATLVLVAGAYLIDEVGEWANARLMGRPEPESAAAPAPVRRGPNPFEGLIGMTARDYAIAGLITAGTAVLLFWNITYPKGRQFDEIYYARAAQEYLTHHDLYEWTHPPLTKLILAASAWFFGLFGYGDPYGARMGSAVMGTLTVPLLYAFAKRLFSSTAASVASVILLIASGYSYVESRLALPEISVAFFALLTLYCFYRYWTAAQIAPAAKRVEFPRIESAMAVVGLLLALIVLVYAQVAVYNAQAWNATIVPYAVAVALFGSAVAYGALAWRRRRTGAAGALYPDGSFVDGSNVAMPFGDVRPLRSQPLADGDATVTWTADGVETKEGSDSVVWRSDGSIEGVIDGRQVKDRQLWGLWLALSACSLAAFISSKWDGLFGLVALWFVATAVAAQQFLPAIQRAKPQGAAPRRFAWGNPIAIRLPLYIATSIFGILVIYVLTYVPNWSGAISTGSTAIGHAGFAGLLSLQYQMFHYHATLKATHIYSSKWWTWPLELRPVSYYYTAVSGTQPPNQIVAEVLGVPNPGVWLGGLVTVPWAAYLAWRQRHKGVMLLIVAYFAQWLPWAGSPRIDFLYNFYPNLAVICLCSAYVMSNVWRAAAAVGSRWTAYVPSALYIALCVGLFVYFFPIWAGTPIPWHAWIQRMWLPSSAPYGWI